MMDFFTLENKDSVLCSLNGNKLHYRFDESGLTTDINNLRRKIEEALKLRNWNVPGIAVEFYYSVDVNKEGTGKDEHTMKVHKIRCTDPKLCADVDIISWEVRNGGMEMSLHADNSGSLDVYCGTDWEKDRNEFVNGKKFHRKMDGKSRIVLQYNTHYGDGFNATDDGDRGHFPDGSEREPIRYSISDVEKHMLEGMNDMLDYIESHKVEVVNNLLFAEPNPTYLTNPIFTGTKFTSTISRDGHYRLKSKEYRGNHGMQGGWRLLGLSISPPRNHPYGHLMNDGFIYCGIEWPDGKVDNHNWHYRSDEAPVAINLEKVDNVFVIDQGAAEKFKDDWFKDNPGVTTMTDPAYNQMLIERACTMVHINDYKGDFAKPVVVICRTLSRNELVLLKMEKK